MNSPPQASNEDRRTFLKKALALAIGSTLGAAPFGAGLAVLLSPLRRKTGRGQAVFVAALGAVPDDGTPRKFAVVATREDAWNRAEGIIGAVFLRRVGSAVQAFNVACPHAGCVVEYSASRSGFSCPCHNSRFGLDGAISDPRSPAARGLDALDVELRNDGQVWVKFRNFRSGSAEKVAM